MMNLWSGKINRQVHLSEKNKKKFMFLHASEVVKIYKNFLLKVNFDSNENQNYVAARDFLEKRRLYIENRVKLVRDKCWLHTADEENVRSKRGDNNLLI